MARVDKDIWTECHDDLELTEETEDGPQTGGQMTFKK